MAVAGFVGLGNMGEPMVRRLAAAGHTVLAYDASPWARERLGGVGGVTITETVTGVAVGADTVILMLPDSRVVEHVLLGDNLLGQIPPSAVLVDMSSSEPASTQALARRAADKGVTLIDAPVSGGVAGARTGTLTIMAGGSRAALESVRPVLEVLGGKVVHAGDVPGAGHAVKALNNLMSAAHLLVSSEAILAGREFGLDPKVVLDIVNGSSGRSGSTETKWPKYILPGTFDAGFGVRLMLKDIKIALGLEHATHTTAPLSEAVVAVWAAAAEALPDTADHTEIARWLEDQMRAGRDGGE